MQQQHTLFDSRTGSFLITLLISGNRLERVFLHQVDISDGIIYLVKIFSILLRRRHTTQFGDHLLAIATGHHLCHRDTGIKLQFIRRVHADHLSERLIGFFLLTYGSLQLSHQEPLSCFLFAAHLMTDDLPQIRYRFLILTQMDIIIGIGIIPLLHGSPVHGVTLHLGNHILSIVEPVLFDIALGQPCPRLTVDGRLGGIEPAHIGKGGGSILEGALMKL